MILLLDPLSKPVAISEILIILAIVAFIGWLIGRWMINGKIKSLRSNLDALQSELDHCRDSQSHTSFLANTVNDISDNLKLIEGIGPKIEKLLQSHDIKTFKTLAQCSEAELNSILRNAGSRFQIHDPGTWPKQAALARDEKWDELTDLQDRLNGGVA